MLVPLLILVIVGQGRHQGAHRRTGGIVAGRGREAVRGPGGGRDDGVGTIDEPQLFRLELLGENPAQDTISLHSVTSLWVSSHTRTLRVKSALFIRRVGGAQRPDEMGVPGGLGAPALLPVRLEF